MSSDPENSVEPIELTFLKPYDCGFQYGERCKPKIREHVNRILRSMGTELPIKEVCRKIVCRYYLRAIKQFCPDAFKLMNGIARGSGEKTWMIIVLNSVYDLKRTAAMMAGTLSTTGDCPPLGESVTGIFTQNVTEDCHDYCAYSWSDARSNADLLVQLHYHDTGPKGRPGIWTPVLAGQIVGQSGMNSMGMVVATNALVHAGDKVPGAWAVWNPRHRRWMIRGGMWLPVSFVSWMFLGKRGFERGRDAVHQGCRRLHVSQSFSLLPGEVRPGNIDWANYETTPKKKYLSFGVYPDKCQIRTNHFLRPFLAQDDEWPDLEKSRSLKESIELLVHRLEEDEEDEDEEDNEEQEDEEQEDEKVERGETEEEGTEEGTDADSDANSDDGSDQTDDTEETRVDKGNLTMGDIRRIFSYDQPAGVEAAKDSKDPVIKTFLNMLPNGRELPPSHCCRYDGQPADGEGREGACSMFVLYDKTEKKASISLGPCCRGVFETFSFESHEVPGMFRIENYENLRGG